MTEILPGNGLHSSLAADLTAGATTLRIVTADAAKWPTGGEYRAVICQDPSNGPYELVRVIGGQGTDTLTITRAVESYNGDQTARAWTTGASISAVITQSSLQLAAGIIIPLSQHLTFSPDGTYDIGASAANRPRTIYSQYSIVAGGSTPLTLGAADAGAYIAPSIGGSLMFATDGLARWFIDYSNGGWMANTDNTYDIGASGANRPRDLFLGRNLTVSGGTVLGTTGSDSTTRLLVTGPGTGATALTGQWQAGIYSQQTFSSAATTYGYAVQARVLTINAAFTMATGAGFYVMTPSLGAGSAITTLYGLYVSNQGVVGVTNAYGVYISAQSGAATTNVGLYNAGITRFANHVDFATDNTYDIGLSGARPRNIWIVGNIHAGSLTTDGNLDMNGQRVVNLYAVEQNGTHSGSYFLRMQNNSGVSWRDSANSYDASLIFDASNRFSFIGTASKATVTIGSANEYIRNPTGSATNLNVMSSDGWVVASGSIGGNLGGNTDFDGVSIWNRFNVANPASLLQLSGGGFYYFTAPAAANPISWTQVASINTAGVLTTTGTGFTYSLGTDTVGALLKLGPGYGIIQSVSGHLYLRTSGGANGVQMDTGSGGLNVTGGPVTSATFKMSGGGQWSGAQARGYGAPIQDVGQGDVILGGPASNLYMHPNLTVGISQTYPTISFFGFSGLNCNGVVTNSARRYKSDIVTIKDALELVLDPELEGTHFTYNPPLAVEKDIQKYGFIADPWHEKAPDTVTLDAEGLPAALDYQQVTAILFQAFKEYVGQTDARINQLEAELSRRNT